MSGPVLIWPGTEPSNSSCWLRLVLMLNSLWRKRLLIACVVLSVSLGSVSYKYDKLIFVKLVTRCTSHCLATTRLLASGKLSRCIFLISPRTLRDNPSICSIWKTGQWWTCFPLDSRSSLETCVFLEDHSVVTDTLLVSSRLWKLCGKLTHIINSSQKPTFPCYDQRLNGSA